MAQLLSIIDNWIPYLDDIIIFSNTKLDHDKILCRVLNFLQENNVDINFKRCEFLKNPIHFLGFVLTENGYEADPKKVEAIVNAPVPRSITELESVMGMI